MLRRHNYLMESIRIATACFSAVIAVHELSMFLILQKMNLQTIQADERIIIKEAYYPICFLNRCAAFRYTGAVYICLVQRADGRYYQGLFADSADSVFNLQRDKRQNILQYKIRDVFTENGQNIHCARNPYCFANYQFGLIATHFRARQLLVRKSGEQAPSPMACRWKYRFSTR